MRVNETENPGVSDSLPDTVQNVLNKTQKLTPDQVVARIPPPSSNYKALIYPDRPSKSNLTEYHWKEPYQYFDHFLNPNLRANWATWTNVNAERKRAEEDQELGHIPGRRQRRFWDPTSLAEIGVFIGCILLMGLTSNSNTNDYWSRHTDTGRNGEICQVCYQV